MSPRNSEPPSLTESMQLMDEVLSDGRMDRLEKIERLEAILSTITAPSDTPAPPSNVELSPMKCICTCHDNKQIGVQQNNMEVDHVACQTLSTGDIVITRIFFTEAEKERERLLNSPKK